MSSRSSPLALALLVLSLLLRLTPARAEEIPRCTAEIGGAATCMAGRVCECAFKRGGLMTGEPDGWRWDCGILRPSCGPRFDAAPGAVALPPGLSLYRSDNSVRVNQGNQNSNDVTSGPEQGTGVLDLTRPPDTRPGPPKPLFPRPIPEIRPIVPPALPAPPGFAPPMLVPGR